MDYQKVVLDNWQFFINPSEWQEDYVDMRTYKRTINGTLKQIGDVKKKRFSFNGVNYSNDPAESDVLQLEDKFTAGGAHNLTTPAGDMYSIIITKFEKTYQEKRLILYRIEAEEK